jgi:hypothetical protein
MLLMDKLSSSFGHGHAWVSLCIAACSVNVVDSTVSSSLQPADPHPKTSSGEKPGVLRHMVSL